MERGKRGLSPVIAVVLLVMITVVAASIIIAFVVPFTRENLDSGKSCFDILGDLEFTETQYNCINASSDGLGRTGFSLRIENSDIIGFRVSLEKTGSSDVYEITNKTSSSEIRMLSGIFDQVLSVPKKGEVRTYVAKGTFDRVSIYPLLSSGAECELADEIDELIICEIEAGSLVGSP